MGSKKKKYPPISVIPMSLDSITEVVASVSGVSKADMRHRSRYKNNAIPRFVAIYLMWKYINQPNNGGPGSTTMIGRYFGGRDHTTVLSAVKGMKNMIDTNNREYLDILDSADIEINKKFKIMKKVKAVFKGQNGSCGYETDKEYLINITHDGEGYIRIERADGPGGHNDYTSMIAFLNNWDSIRHV